MGYKCKILLDSISETGKRITTMEVTFPRIVLAEFNTHRMFSRNSASSRAIPFDKQVQRVLDDPFIPEKFPLNCSGMQPQEYIDNSNISEYKGLVNAWLNARSVAINHAKFLSKDLDVHKQICNRLLEPFMWHTVIVTATEFDNFFKLRTHPDAQYEIRKIADLMYDAYHGIGTNSLSDVRVIGLQKLNVGEWHCPLVYEEDLEPICELATGYDFPDSAVTELKKKVSVARCARVSYLTHDGKRDTKEDLKLFERLKTSGHYSPFEHIAQPSFDKQRWNQFQSLKANREEFEKIKPIDLRNANFIGWRQMRQDLPNENCTYFRKEEK